MKKQRGKNRGQYHFYLVGISPHHSRAISLQGKSDIAHHSRVISLQGKSDITLCTTVHMISPSDIHWVY